MVGGEAEQKRAALKLKRPRGANNGRYFFPFFGPPAAGSELA